MSPRDRQIQQLKKQLEEYRRKERVFQERELALAEANVKAILLLEEVEDKNAIIEVQRAELEEFSQALETRVEERTRELAEAHSQLKDMVTRLQAQRDRLEQLANTDTLTELYNHRYFQERLDAELSRAKRYNRPVSLLLIDVDHFKLVNDNLGHPVGDALIQQLAGVLKRSFRTIDVVARYGGDEFAAILPEIDASAALVIAERLRHEVERTRITIAVDHGKKKRISATVTIGVAAFPDHSDNRDGLIVASDIAMYSGKYLSRNRVNIYTPPHHGDQDTDPYEMYRLLHEPSVSALATLAAAVDARDSATAGHSNRVTMYALGMAQHLNLPKEDMDRLKVAGMLHDVGKLGVPDNILYKPSTLTAEERRSIQQHAEMGKTILESVPQMEAVLPIVLYHHERWDGQGYPARIRGSEIPLLARILAVADSYDAMTSDRPYRDAMSHAEALAELRRCSDKQFDPAVVEAFHASMEQQIDIQKAA